MINLPEADFSPDRTPPKGRKSQRDKRSQSESSSPKDNSTKTTRISSPVTQDGAKQNEAGSSLNGVPILYNNVTDDLN